MLPERFVLYLEKSFFAIMLTEGLQQTTLGYNAEGPDRSSFCKIEEIGLI